MNRIEIDLFTSEFRDGDLILSINGDIFCNKLLVLLRIVILKGKIYGFPYPFNLSRRYKYAIKISVSKKHRQITTAHS